MPSLFDPQAPETLRSRIDRLTASSQPLWGKMNVGQMVVHCDRQLLLALGELTAEPMKTPVGRFPFKQLALYLPYTPKGVPTMPEIRNPVTGEWQQDREKLKADIGRVIAKDRSRPWPVHPAFGTLTVAQWALLIHKHLDHHLRQFGV